MKLKISAYASVKDLLGESFEIEVNDGCTIEELKKKIAGRNPEAAELINICRFAVNESIVNEIRAIKEDEHVHIIPPASGG